MKRRARRPDHEDEDDVPLTKEWLAEIERRLADEPAAGERWPTGEEVIARLRALAAKDRRKRGRRSR